MMKGVRQGIGLAFGILALGFVGPAVAQENLDSGKTPAQLFASDCAICHKTTQGLAKASGVFGLKNFLREHYTASKETAAAIAAYVESTDKGPPPKKRGTSTKRTAKGDAKSKKDMDRKDLDKKDLDKKDAGKKDDKTIETKTGKTPDDKAGEAKSETKSKGKPDAKTGDAKPTEAKPTEAKPTEATSTEAKSGDTKSAESKPAEAKASGTKAGDAKADAKPDIKSDDKPKSN
jgi:hypothetical protein